jgi:mono/diheme cytochrome c family protein
MKWLSLCSVVLWLLVGFHAPRGDSVRFGDPIAGQRLFAAKGCVRCHAGRGAGGRIGPDLGRTTGDSYYDIASMMWNHSGGMRRKMEEFRVPLPRFEADELSDLISFLYFLNYFDEPGDQRAGKVLFTEKHCIRCHRVGAEGGEGGPALDTIPRGTSPLRIAEALWNHGPAMMSAIEEAGLEVPEFVGNEIIDLFAFVRSHGDREGSPRFEAPGDPERGRELFESKGCSACHALFEGDAGVGPDLGRMELRGSVTQIAGRMWNHWPDMARTMSRAGMDVPEFGKGELADLFAYLFIARYVRTPGDPARGRAVYEGKGCAVCHESDVAPALPAATADRTAELVMTAMWNHAARMDVLMPEKDLAWVQLSADDLADLLAFLGSASQPDGE